MSFCTRYTKVAWAHTGVKKAIFTRLRCKQWSCPECAKKNAWIWREHLQRRLPEVSDEWWLMTLTANRETRSLKSSLDNLRSNIDKMFKRIRRVFGKVSYVRVYEKHPTSDAIHAHFIVSGFTPYVALGCSEKLQPMSIACLTRKGRNGVWAVRTWIKKTANDCGMGYIADVKRIAGDAMQAMFYVLKYLTKSQQDIPIKGLRHVQTSHDIGSMRYEDGDYVWLVGPYIEARQFDPNTRIIDLNTGEIIDNTWWEKHTLYPID